MNIIEVDNSKLQKQFIDFPHDLYKDDPYYVPEIYIGQKELLSPKKNPFFKHSKVALFLAKRNNQIVGRIAAIRNNNYIEYTGEQIGFFGLFDVIDDQEVANTLLQTAIDWIKKEGLIGINGPANLSSNDTFGLLVEGYDDSPLVMMTYNKRYYKDFLENFGFEKKTDLLAYFLTPEGTSKRTLKLASALEQRLQRNDIIIRKVNMKDFKNEAKKIKEVYNAAWEKNWGFVPATDEEFAHLAEGLKLVIDPDFVYIAEQKGKMIAFALTLPDINQIVKTMKKGRLLPFGIFKLLFQKKKITRVRVVTLGVIEDFRKMGIEAVFYAKMIQTALDKNIKTAEASWILEDNEMMNKGLIDLNAKVYKRYRVYNLSFSPEA